MTSIDPKALRLKIGLELHQQLATKSKLFCSCSKFEENQFTHSFVRRLRPTQSELGQIDQAAVFEFDKDMSIKYLTGEDSACLVEADEEPPHDLNIQAVESAILIALALKSQIVDEIHVMRKLVIDGSNTTGFQRTAIIALGGQLDADNISVPVQSISVEEDAARLLEDSDGHRKYGLDRLGVPLIEVALDPFTGTPKEVKHVALSLGRLMRTTKRVARGLGTVRQDLNISIGGGEVVEIKGIQKIDLLAKTVEYEALRQSGLREIAVELKKRKLDPRDQLTDPVDLSSVFGGTRARTISSVLAEGGAVYGGKLRGFRGLLGFEPHSGVRLGKEMSDFVRFYGLGGLFHSDELPAYGINYEEVKKIEKILKVTTEDAFVLVAGRKEDVVDALQALRKRTREAHLGAPAETRGPTPDGKTRYIRPRPGGARMYPETDIAPIPITSHVVERLSKEIPKPWRKQIEDYKRKYNLNEKLTTQILDSQYASLFEEISSSTKVSSTFIATTLTEMLVSLNRDGLETSLITYDMLRELFRTIDYGEVSKEAVQGILELILKGKATSVQEAKSRLKLTTLSDVELHGTINKVVSDNIEIIREKGEHAFQPLMGMVMKRVRGKVDGERVGNLLRSEIRQRVGKYDSSYNSADKP